MAGFQPSIFWLANSQASFGRKLPLFFLGSLNARPSVLLYQQFFTHCTRARTFAKFSHSSASSIYPSLFCDFLLDLGKLFRVQRFIAVLSTRPRTPKRPNMFKTPSPHKYPYIPIMNKIWIFGFEKAPGLNDRKSPYIV
jgi:hypothetical protein